MGSIPAAYLSAEHRDNLRHGCPLAALGNELARSDKRVRDVATTGFSRMVEILVAHFDGSRAAEARKRDHGDGCGDDRCRNDVARTGRPKVV
jgi:TetR/AcrR family transcriptional regulator, transcriptional repressor for nem operon